MKSRVVVPLLLVLMPNLGWADVTFPAGPIRPSGDPVMAKAATTDGYRISVDRQSLLEAVASGVVELPGRDGSPMLARDPQVRQHPLGALIWHATVDTPMGRQSAVITLGPDAVFGLVPQRSGAPLTIEPRGGDLWLVERASEVPEPSGPDFLLPERVDPSSRAKREAQDARPATGTPVVDVAVMYNAELVDVWGSNAAVLARIAHLEGLTNQAYADTGMDAQVRVVAAQLVDYALRNDNDDALRELTGPTALPIHAEANRLRAQYGADLVKLMRNFDRSTQNSCGVGWLGGYRGSAFEAGDGFSVTSDHGYRGDNCGDYTFAHELGHNLGAHHDIETTEGDYGAYPYSRGHRQTLDASEGFATVMAYTAGPQVRIGRFSNPLQSDCLSRPCGIADESDNARGIVQAAPSVAAYRATVVPGAGPSVSVSDASVTEGNSGQVSARFTFTLSAPVATGVTLSLATAHGSASGADYVGATASFLIPAGQTQATYDVRVRGDTISERNEVFALNILSANGAWVADGQGVATILNDDPLPTLDVADIQVSEGNAGTTQATFTATLSQPATTAVSFDVKTDEFAPGPASATMALDFEDTRLTGVRIEPGQSSVQFAIPIYGDTLDEEDERVLVMVSNVTAAAVGDIFARVVIVDDDGAAAVPTLSIADASAPEGNAGQSPVSFDVTLSAPAAQDVTFSVSAKGITAAAGEDFVAPAASALRIPAGQVRLSVPVPVIGDVLDEADEVFALRIDNLAGAEAQDGLAYARISDDDGSATTPAMVARDDRFVVLEQGGAVRLPVIGNDALEPARLAGGSLALASAPTGGGASIDNGGTPATAADDVIVYLPRAGESGPDAFAYRVCEGAGRCSQARVWIERRPHADVALEGGGDGGFVDLGLDRLPALPDLWVRSIAPQASLRQSFVLAADPTPETPWDLDLAGTAAATFDATPEIVFDDRGIGTPIATRIRWLVDALPTSGDDVDLYVGIDDNGDGRPDPGEVECVAAMTAGIERCESAFTTPANGATPLWLMLHARSGRPQSADAEFHLFQFERASPASSLRATGPGRVPAGQPFGLRISWRGDELEPGQRATALVAIGGEPGGALPRVVPATLARSGGTNGALPAWERTRRVWLEPGVAADRVFVDVPAGTTGLVVSVDAPGPVDLHLSRLDPAAGPAVGPAPPRDQALVVATGLSGFRQVTVPAGQVAPGRWYLTATSRAAQGQWASLSLVASGEPRLPVRGSYYNPARGGHGLFVYPAGSQWAGLWYTYLQDGSPTWYYLQAGAPSTASGRWTTPIYRSAWNGSRSRSNPVGQASLVALADGVAAFTYELDGQVGSERLEVFGAGCPQLAGAPVDASSHWFDPARAGTGYSVQLFPDYEFHAAFLYDALGVPRFLTAESQRFAGADATLPLEQLQGFCPLCERAGAPARADIGTLRRRFSAGTLAGMEVDAVYTAGVPGAWSAIDAVQALGGPGTTQGCPTP